MGLLKFLDRIYAEDAYIKWKTVESKRETLEQEIRAFESKASSILRNGGLFAGQRFREYRRIIKGKQAKLAVLKTKELKAKERFKQVEGDF